MSAAYHHKPVFDSTKHIVTLMHGTKQVGRIIFREQEYALSQECLIAASAIDTSDENAVRAFVSAWYEQQAQAQEAGGNGSGWARPDKYRPRRVWHTNVGD